MKSLRELYRVGRGPSSSHTIAPGKIAAYALAKYGHVPYRVRLFGSLALTGRGHGTDRVIREVLGDRAEIIFDTKRQELPHPNYMEIYEVTGDGERLLFTAVSPGGGAILIDGQDPDASGGDVYPEQNFSEVCKSLIDLGITLPEYVRLREPGICSYLLDIWNAMRESVERGQIGRAHV